MRLPVKKLRRLVTQRRKTRVFVRKGIRKNIFSNSSSAVTINLQPRRRIARSHSVLLLYECRNFYMLIYRHDSSITSCIERYQ